MNTVKQLMTTISKHNGTIYADMLMRSDVAQVRVYKNDILALLRQWAPDDDAPMYANHNEDGCLYLHAAHE